MELLGIGGIAAITVICYLIGMGVKVSPLDDKYIPLTVGICGAGLGVVAMYVMPNFTADNVIEALAVGIVSGLAATGIDQMVKQLTQ